MFCISKDIHCLSDTNGFLYPHVLPKRIIHFNLNWHFLKFNKNDLTEFSEYRRKYFSWIPSQFVLTFNRVSVKPNSRVSKDIRFVERNLNRFFLFFFFAYLSNKFILLLLPPRWKVTIHKKHGFISIQSTQQHMQDH